MPLDHGLRTGTEVEFCLVLIAVWVWGAEKAVTETPGSGEARVLLTLPGARTILGCEEGRSSARFFCLFVFSSATFDWQQN